MTTNPNLADLTDLAELVAAVRDGSVTDVMAFVDNDNVTFYDDNGNGEHLLSLHPYDVQTEALTLLGITAEPV